MTAVRLSLPMLRLGGLMMLLLLVANEDNLFLGELGLFSKLFCFN